MKRGQVLPLAAALVAVAITAGWLARPADPAPAQVLGSAGARGGAPTAEQPAGATSTARATDEAALHDDLLTADLRLRLESLLLEAGEAPTPEALKRKLPALVDRHFGPAQAVRALALATCYVDFRVALGEVRRPTDAGDPHALRAAIDARQRERARFFTPDEDQALFAQEDELDRFTLARLEIERNGQLDAAQKTTALGDAERQLGEAQRALRAEVVAQAGVAAQTAAFDAASVGERERYAERSARYGDAAALRLAQLDREQHDWQSRLDVYATAQAQRPAGPDARQLRDRLFTPEEQLRLPGALALRAMAATTPAQR